MWGIRMGKGGTEKGTSMSWVPGCEEILGCSLFGMQEHWDGLYQDGEQQERGRHGDANASPLGACSGPDSGSSGAWLLLAKAQMWEKGWEEEATGTLVTVVRACPHCGHKRSYNYSYNL